MEAPRCPRCRQAAVVFSSPYVPAEGFVPRHSGVFANPVPTPARSACVACGLVWSSVDPARIREVIGAYGGELARQHLDEIDRGPYRGLPDTAAAREIGDKVAEVDALVRSGAPAAGRYREMRGVTWDEAHRDVRRWHELTRDEKLELFGWVAKKKPAVDDFDTPFP